LYTHDAPHCLTERPARYGAPVRGLQSSGGRVERGQVAPSMEATGGGLDA
jgi:hypothetical protein